MIMKVSLPIDDVLLDTNADGTFEFASLFTQPSRGDILSINLVFVKEVPNLIQQNQSGTLSGRN